MASTIDRNLLHAAVDAMDERKIEAIIDLLEAMQQAPQSVRLEETTSAR